MCYKYTDNYATIFLMPVMQILFLPVPQWQKILHAHQKFRQLNICHFRWLMLEDSLFQAKTKSQFLGNTLHFGI